MENNSTNKPQMIGVHTLSEFVFCPRAGIISHEQKKDDSGVDTGFVDLSDSPNYDIGMLTEERRAIIKRVEQFTFGLLGGTIATLVFGMSPKPFLGFLCLLVLVPAAIFLAIRVSRDLKRYFQIKKQLAEYESQNEQTPKLEERIEVIPWYSLLKSFDVEKCHDLLLDEELGIAGTPWKLLHREKATLPVFFSRRPSAAEDGENDPTQWLKPKHFVRMHAYCHLIKKSTGKNSPCGIIVFAGTLDAIAINFQKDEAADHKLNEALFFARQNLAEFKEHEKVGVPATHTCIRCRFGRPKLYRLEPGAALRNGKSVRPTLHKIVVEGEAKTFHSVCGDFFKWIPPHETAEELKLAELAGLIDEEPIEEFKEPAGVTS